jgi:hypothetical protein
LLPRLASRLFVPKPTPIGGSRLLGKPVAHSLFHFDCSRKCSEKAHHSIVLFRCGERRREAARIIDLHVLRIAAGSQGWNRKGYVLWRLVISPLSGRTAMSYFGISGNEKVEFREVKTGILIKQFGSEFLLYPS